MPIIEPSTVNKYTFKNSYEFVQEIKKVDVSNLLMASFDIQSLFTNTPLDETIKITINRLLIPQNTWIFLMISFRNY